MTRKNVFGLFSTIISAIGMVLLVHYGCWQLMVGVIMMVLWGHNLERHT